MPNELFAAAVAACRTVQQTDALAREAWRAWAAGRLSDRDVGELQDVVNVRKQSLRAFVAAPSEHRSATLERRPSRGPSQRRKSLLRRRKISMSGLLPGRLACCFTQAEVAALSVVAREIKKQRHNLCEFPIGKISALAGCSETTTRNALREASHLGIVSITERRRNHRRSLTNLVSITSALWQSWLRLGPRTGRVQKIPGHVVTRDNPTSSAPETTPGATAKPRNRKRRSNFSGRQPINAAVI